MACTKTFNSISDVFVKKISSSNKKKCFKKTYVKILIKKKHFKPFIKLKNFSICPTESSILSLKWLQIVFKQTVALSLDIFSLYNKY